MLHRRLHHLTGLHHALRVLLLCLVLGTMAQAGHLHLHNQATTHTQCDLCAGFGGLMAAPTPSASAVFLGTAVPITIARVDVFAARSITGLPPVRGPPTSC